MLLSLPARFTATRPKPLVLTLLLLGAGLGNPASAESVTLRYGWPPGLEAAVTFDGTLTRSTGPRQQQRRASGSFGMTTESADGGLLVRYRDFQIVPGGPENPDPQQAKVQRVLLEAASAVPDYLIGPDGSISRVIGTDALIQGMRSAVREVMQKAPVKSRELVERAMSRALQREALEQRLRQEWNRDVAAWTGATLTRGRVYDLETSAPAPLLGNATVPMRVAFEYLGSLTCPGGRGGTCARLRMTSAVDSAKLGPAIAEFIRSLAPGAQAPDFRIQHLQMTTVVELVSEPSTLVPHEVRSARESRIQLHRNGQTETTRESRVRRVQYRYR